MVVAETELCFEVLYCRIFLQRLRPYKPQLASRRMKLNPDEVKVKSQHLFFCFDDVHVSWAVKRKLRTPSDNYYVCW